MRIEGAWGELLKRRYLAPEEVKRHRIPVNVVIVQTDQSVVNIAAEIGLRGNTSLSPLECTFPKYSLYFSEENVSGTAFAGREQLAVGSHCSYRGGNSPLYGRAYDGKSPLREALLYRLLEILEIRSFKTRPVMVQYVDTTIAGPLTQAGWHQAFLLESLKQFSERHNYELFTEEQANHIDLAQDNTTDLQKLTRAVLFNEMIGNNDWRINYYEIPGLRQTWNVFLAKNLADNRIEVIPNDFDLSSAVTLLDGHVSEPASTLSKLPAAELLVARDFYRRKRESLNAELLSLKKLDPLGYKHIKTKLDRFYVDKIK
jgi:hypothetical protein